MAGPVTWYTAVGAAVSCAVLMLCLPAIVQVTPSLLRCIARARESEHLYNSFSLRRSRDIACIGLIPGFLMVCARYDVHPFTAGMEYGPALGWTAVIFAAYLSVRALCRLIFTHRLNERFCRECACEVPRTFFAGAAVFVIVTGLVCLLGGISAEGVTKALWWEIGAFYTLGIIRKTQIFIQHRGIVAGILYLCTLEFLPTGMLIASAMYL